MNPANILQKSTFLEKRKFEFFTFENAPLNNDVYADKNVFNDLVLKLDTYLPPTEVYKYLKEHQNDGLSFLHLKTRSFK